MPGKLQQVLREGVRTTWRAGRFLLRDPRATLLMLRMAAWVTALSLLVRVMPLPRLMRLITPRVRRPRTVDATLVQAKLARLIDLVLATDLLVFTPTCWKRAPVLYRYLALNGIETRIVFGVRKEGDEGTLAGHAWLEADGQPVLEAREPDYTKTFSFPT